MKWCERGTRGVESEVKGLSTGNEVDEDEPCTPVADARLPDPPPPTLPPFLPTGWGRYLPAFTAAISSAMSCSSRINESNEGGSKAETGAGKASELVSDEVEEDGSRGKARKKA